MSRQLFFIYITFKFKLKKKIDSDNWRGGIWTLYVSIGISGDDIWASRLLTILFEHFIQNSNLKLGTSEKG